MQILVDSGTTLVLLTPSSTKIYKQVGQLSSGQFMDVTVRDGAFFAYLPQYLTLYSDAVFSQKQRIHLTSTSSLIWLDWITSGRLSRAEKWMFKYFASEIKIFIDDVLQIADPWRLQDSPVSSLANRVGPYLSYANMFIIGPKTLQMRDAMLLVEPCLTVVSTFSVIGDGMVIRIAGYTTESVHSFALKILSFGQFSWRDLFQV